jgi:hypothetical protein
MGGGHMLGQRVAPVPSTVIVPLLRILGASVTKLSSIVG